MSKGITRSIVGGLALAFAALVNSGVEDLKSMTPNEVLDRQVSDSQRKKIDDAEKALTQRNGPIFEKAVQECNRENDRAKGGSASFVEYASAALLTAFGRSVEFNSDLCVNHKLKEQSFYIGPMPEKGKATESYKNHVISTGQNGVYVFGGAGGLLLLSGMIGFARSRKRDAVEISSP